MRPTALVVFEDAGYRDLLPLVYPRATFNLRCGGDNLLSKIETAFGTQASALFVRPGLAAVMDERQRTQYPRPRPINITPPDPDQLWINGRLLVRAAFDLPPNSAAWRGDTLLAARLNKSTADLLTPDTLLYPGRMLTLQSLIRVDLPADAATLFDRPWQIVHANEAEIVRQVGALRRERLGRVYPGAHLVDESAIHLAVGSKVKPGAVLDAEAGPIFIGENTVISPNAVVIGPAHIDYGCIVQPGAAIRGATSLGPVCKIGGEVEGTIFHAYANKQHDGFLGHSYVGEWVNLGADTVGSDLKNTYGPVRVALNGREIDTGHTFVGAFIGDHSKTGIGTRLPTGCVIGYACNVFVSSYAPKFTPSFSWLTDDGRAPHDPDKAAAVARTVMARRKRSLTAAEEALLRSIADEAKRVELE